MDIAPQTQYVPRPVNKIRKTAAASAKKPPDGVKRPDPVQLAAILKMFSKGR